MHVEWERTGTTRAGRFAVRVMTLAKGRPIGRSMEKGFKQLEAEPRPGAG